MKKIFLDVDEEITSVIDKLKGASDKEVSLVVPKDSPLLQSVVNLKLIKREAEKEGMDITVVTSNKVGRTLADNIGLKAISGSGEKKEPVKVLAETKEKIEIAYKEGLEDADEENITFSRESLDDSEIKVKENSDDDSIELMDEDLPEDDKSKKAIVPLDDKNGSKKLILRIFNPFAVFVFLTIIGFLVFGYLYIPRATVNVRVASEKKAVEADITIDKNKGNESETVVKGEIVELKKDFSKKYQSTGKKDVGTKATGTIKINNLYSTSAQTLVAGTRFESGGFIFKTTAQVVVPGYTDPPKTAGTVNVNVEAESSGSNYNIGPSNFNIPAFTGTDKYSKITGSSTSAMSGGLTKEVKIVRQEDYSQAKIDFTNEVKEGVKKELQGKIKEGEALADEAIDFGIGEISSNPAVGGEGDEFTLTANVASSGLSYKSDDLKKAFNKKIKDEFGSSKEVVDDGYENKKLTISKVDFKNGTLNASVATEAFFGSVIDKDRVKAEIMGQTESKSLEYFKNLENVKDVKIEFWPAFLKRIPRIEKHVIINTEAFQE